MSISKKSDLKKIFDGEIILKSMPEFAYVFDKQERLVMWNKNLEDVLGYTKEELHHKNVYEFMAEDDKDINKDAIRKIFDEQEEQTLRQNILTKTGKKIPVIDTACYATINGEEYLVGMAIDISELNSVEQKLKKQIIKTNLLRELLNAENIYLRKEIKSVHGFDKIIGESKPLLDTLYQIEQVAKTNTVVLIKGEIGTRKEIYARAINELSDRKHEPFIRINCALLKKEAFEKELYNYILQFFTEVDKEEEEEFQIVNKGTLYFEEISAIPIAYQLKLLTMFKNCKIEMSGHPMVMYLDVKIIVSTNQNLDKLVRENLFFNDLYFYLNSFPITIPPLRERISDIPILVESYVSQFNRKYTKQITNIPNKVIESLKNASWMGNIMELENVIERAVIISNTSTLKIIPFSEKEMNLDKKILPLADFEHQYITRVLNLTFWRIAGEKGAAKLLGLHPETLRSKMRKLKITKPEYV